jgi:hypothetical protein
VSADLAPSFEVTGVDAMRWPRHSSDDFEPSFSVTGVDAMRWPRHSSDEDLEAVQD